MLRQLLQIFTGKPIFKTQEDVIAAALLHLRKHPAVADVRSQEDDPLAIDVWHDSDGEPSVRFNLHNLVQHLLGRGLSATAQQEQFDIWIQSTQDIFDVPGIIRDNLRPMVRHMDYVAAIGYAPEDPKVSVRPLAGDLFGILMQETESSFRTPPLEDLAEANLTEEDAWQEAFKNLDRHLDSLEISKLADGFFALHLPEAPLMAGSLLLLPEKIDAILDSTGLSEALIGAPNRHTLFLADQPQRAMLEKVVASEQSADHPQSACIFSRKIGCDQLQPIVFWNGESFVDVE